MELSNEQKLALAKWAGINAREVKSSTDAKVLLLETYDLPYTYFNPETDWNQTKELERKMCKELGVEQIILDMSEAFISDVMGITYYHSEGELSSSGIAEQEAILNAVIKHVEGENGKV
jgi:hypothetical protein